MRSPTPDNALVMATAGVRVELNVPEPENATVLLTAGTTAEPVSVPEPEPRNVA